MLALAAGSFIFLMALIFFSVINSIFPIFSENTIINISVVLAIATTIYNLRKR